MLNEPVDEQEVEAIELGLLEAELDGDLDELALLLLLERKLSHELKCMQIVFRGDEGLQHRRTDEGDARLAQGRMMLDHFFDRTLGAQLHHNPKIVED